MEGLSGKPQSEGFQGSGGELVPAINPRSASSRPQDSEFTNFPSLQAGKKRYCSEKPRIP